MSLYWLKLCYRYTVSGGSVTLSVPARSAIGLHTGQVGTGSPGGGGSGSGTVTVTFHVNATTVIGGEAIYPPVVALSDDGWFLENIFITGSISQLSDWSTTSAIALSSATYPIWAVTISM